MRHGAGAHGFLSDVQVAEAADLAERVRLGAALLEAALEQHRLEQLEIQRGVALRSGLGLSLGGCPGGSHVRVNS